MTTLREIHSAHANCPLPTRKGSDLADAQGRIWMLYGRCLVCGNRNLWWDDSGEMIIMDFHHIVPKRRGKQERLGGRDCIANLVPHCRKCHEQKPLRPKDILRLLEFREPGAEG